uniref:Uncharacterized protein n=1 Tax=Oryza punctata TaxID=4537 RepID=A0A0E0K1K2_ORYPU
MRRRRRRPSFPSPSLSPPSRDGSGNGGVGGDRGWIRPQWWRPRTNPAAVAPSALSWLPHAADLMAVAASAAAACGSSHGGGGRGGKGVGSNRLTRTKTPTTNEVGDRKPYVFFNILRYIYIYSQFKYVWF